MDEKDFERMIIEKYADKVSPVHRAALQAIGMARMLLNQHEGAYRELIESRDWMDSIGGLLDPTFYRDVLYSKNLARQIRLVKVTLAFLKEVNEVAKEVEDG